MAVSLAAGHIVELEKVTSIARTLGARVWAISITLWQSVI